MPLVWSEQQGEYVHISTEPGGAVAVDLWKLEGYDTFEGESYPLDGTYGTETAAVQAAKDRLAYLERTQPSASSGGQGGLQDRVFVVRPDGSTARAHP